MRSKLAVDNNAGEGFVGRLHGAEGYHSTVNLAKMYIGGLGVQKNCTEAKGLMALAENSNTIFSDIAGRELGENFCFSKAGTVNY
ncbi:MAG TPA: hypothetical protein VFQ94_05540 [Gallionella sp.]|nr:hypothetical protein [Gallionella sp.]